MPTFLKDYGTTEGPLGFPMRDDSARALDEVLKKLPKTEEYTYRKSVAANAVSELNPGERSDVSWISTESPDRCQEVVLAKGMNDAQFAKNPLVTLQHNYWCPPVGRSLWRKRIADGALIGIKAKTKYPPRPADWPKDDTGVDTPWPPDKVFSLIQNQLLNGKSIGFLPLKSHVPDDKEYAARGWAYNTVSRVFDEWLLLEYAACFIPMNQDALVEAVSKGTIDLPPGLRRALGLDDALFTPPAPKIVSFTALSEIERAVTAQLQAVDFDSLIQTRIAAQFEQARGRV